MKKQSYRILPLHSEEELQALRESIAANGVRVPIIQDAEGHVLDGFARHEIAEELDIDCPCEINYELRTKAEKRAYVLEMNLARRSSALKQSQRKEFAECLFIGNPALSCLAVANLVGVSESTANNYRTALRKARKLPAELKTVGKDGVCRSVNHSKKNRRKRQSVVLCRNQREAKEVAPILAECQAEVNGGRIVAGTMREKGRKLSARKRAIDAKITKTPKGITIEHCDFRALKVQPGSASLVFTDPPWSLDCVNDWREAAKCAKRWLSSDGIFASMMGTQGLAQFIQAASQHLHYQTMLVTVRKNGTHNYATHTHDRARFIPVFSKSKKINLEGIPNTLLCETLPEKDFHAWQQNIEEVKTWVSRLCRKGLVIDSFVGTGTTAIACRELGLSFIGCDIDADQVAVARYRLSPQANKVG